MNLEPALAAAIDAAHAAGAMLRADFHRPGGARGHDDKAEADTEAEREIRGRLLKAFPDWGFLGEETGRVGAAPGQPVWLVDPNDGTRDYLKGRRGSSVSIGLAIGGRPVLGVVYAFAYPDDDGDLFAWAEGCGPVRRNGVPVAVAHPDALDALSIVLVSSTGDQDPEGNLECSAPARYRAVPSIAHRLALLSAGEATAVTSLFAPGAWDYAAGHALVLASGGVLVDEGGAPVAYAEDGTSKTLRAFAGSARVAVALAQKPWDTVKARGGWPGQARLERGHAVADSALLSRAHGCLLGQIAGDSLGSLVEFKTSEAIARLHPDGPRLLADGGTFDTLAGQATDDSEMALALARSILAEGGHRPEAVAQAYREWYRSRPFDMGNTIRAAVQGYLMAESQANGSLMRVSPLAVYAHALAPERAAALARDESSLTHPNPVCRDATAAYVVGVAHAVRYGDGAKAAYEAALGWARANAVVEVRGALEAAAREAPVCEGQHMGWVLIALQNAFHQLLRAPSLEEAVVATVRRGGDTDTNAAIAGALAGAVHGRAAIPSQWRQMVLSCRPHPMRAVHPRPPAYWPVDVLEIAERLVLLGRSAG